MYVILKNYAASPHKILNICGYYRREKEGDYIKEDTQGRFHAHLADKKNRVIDIHYDLYVEWRHVTFDTPIKHNTERKRILRMIDFLKTYELDKEKINRIFKNTKYAQK